MCNVLSGTAENFSKSVTRSVHSIDEYEVRLNFFRKFIRLMKTKTVLKRTIKVVLFMLIFIIILSVVTNILMPLDETGFQSIQSFYEEPENSLDAVYIGSSNCLAFWNPLVSWNKYGIAVSSYASNSNSFYSTKHLIKEARKTQPDALFIVNINTLSEVIEPRHIRRLVDCMPFSLNKMALINQLSSAGDFSFSDSLEYYFPIIRYHDLWVSAGTSNLNKQTNGLKGAYMEELYLSVSTDVREYYVTTDEQEPLPDKLSDFVNDLLDYCDEENVRVLFVTVPQARGSESDIRRINTVNALIEERGYPVLDLINNIEETELDLATDFYDKRHTNIHGSVKFTTYLSEYLIENYNFTDKRNDDAYESWDISYDKYTDEMSQYLLDFEFTASDRAYSLVSPVLELKTAENETVLSWNEIEGADGYLVYSKADIDSAWERVAQVAELCYEVLPGQESGYYTVVPYVIDNGVTYYGNFSYSGIQLTIE